MPYRKVPYLERLQSDPAHLESVAQRFVTRLSDPSNTHRQYEERLKLLPRHYEASRSEAYNRAVRDLFGRITVLSEERGLFAPSAAMLLCAANKARSTSPFHYDPEDGYEEASRLLTAMRETPISGRSTMSTMYLNDRGTARTALDLASLWNSACEYCSQHYLSDSEAEQMRRTWDDNLVCFSCADQYYQYSDYYDSLLPTVDAVEARDRDGSWVTVSCEDDDFVYDDDDDERVHVRFQSPDRVIRSYHSSKSAVALQADHWTSAHNRFMGVELEVEMRRSLQMDTDRDNAAKAIHAAVNQSQYGKKLFFETDGSLSFGFEMITQPMSLPALREVFGFLHDAALVQPLRSHTTDTCGLHVHVSRSGLTNLTIGRAVTFVHDPVNEPFISALARRYNNGYCRVVRKEVTSAHIPVDRYEAVNLTGNATVEFRLFRGSLRYEAVIAAVEFCHALLEFCARPILASEALRYDHFLAWCAAELPDDTSTLRAYAAERLAARQPSILDPVPVDMTAPPEV